MSGYPRSPPPQQPYVNGHGWPYPPVLMPPASPAMDAAAHQTLGRIEAQQGRIIEIGLAQLHEQSRTREVLTELPARLAAAIPAPAPMPPPQAAPPASVPPPGDALTWPDRIKLGALAALALVTVVRVALGKVPLGEALGDLCKPLGCG